MHSEDTLVRQALDAGARGYVLKSAVDLELAAAIRSVAAGEQVLAPELDQSGDAEGRSEVAPDHARTANSAADRRRKIE